MRLHLVLSALAASAQLTHGLRNLRAQVTTYPKCDAATTKQFTDSLSTASSGCATSTSYVWDGDADPTDAQRAQICKCTVSAFNVPKCHWTKLGQYDVSTKEHFNFVYNCSSSSGKPTPKLTEIGEASAIASTPASTNPKCTASLTEQFTTSLNTASNNCTASSSYVWDGDADPTDAQRAEICDCTVSPFNVPKCHWTKLGKYDVTTTEHFNFVYNCSSISGKATPKVTVVDTAAATPTSTSDSQTPAAPTATSSASASSPVATTAADLPTCTAEQLTAFTSALKIASGGCMGGTSYSWGGTTDPTQTQYAEICKCNTVSAFTLPNCSIMKLQYKVTLAVHYNWVMSTQCPTFSPSTGSNSASTSDSKSSSSNAGLIAGIVACVILIIALIIGFVLYTRHRKNKEDDDNVYDARIAMRAPVDYQPMGGRREYERKETNKEQAALRSRVDHLTSLVEQQTVLIQELSGSLPPANAGQRGTPSQIPRALLGEATPLGRTSNHSQTL